MIIPWAMKGDQVALRKHDSNIPAAVVMIVTNTSVMTVLRRACNVPEASLADSNACSTSNAQWKEGDRAY